MGKIILVTGGARSGKSSFAEEYVSKCGSSIAYIATSQIYDDEMAYRVKLHRSRRPAAWQTLEAPFEAHEALAAAFAEHDTVLFDCITLYLSNYLCSDAAQDKPMDELTAHVRSMMQQLADAVHDAGSGKTAVFVTNEVGAGIVPENALARCYRDLAGIANQYMAARAAEVYFAVAGIPLKIK